MKKKTPPSCAELLVKNIEYYLDGRSSYWLSQESGVAASTLSRIMNDKINPSLDTIENIARALGVPPSYLLIDNDSKIETEIPADIIKRLGGRPHHVYIAVRHILDAVDAATR